MKKANSATAKALEVNLDPQIYGSFAEIGAGQEVARHFFMAGQASATIAKTISAYDMIVSDEIYGREPSGRYVVESRLIKMLTKEYNLLEKRLGQVRGDRSKFFSYANTVTTGDQSKRICHGWMGIRFQHSAQSPTNDIILHVRMLDRFRLQQQETLGILGANLVHAAFFATQNAKDLIPALTENIRPGQVAIDLIRVNGPHFEKYSNQILNLSLVRRGLAEATLFSPSGEIVLASDELYGKPVLIDRGEFRPISQTQLELVKMGRDQFKKDFSKQEPTTIFEMTMDQLVENGKIDEQDFLDRVETLQGLKSFIMVSNFSLFYRLKRFLRAFTKAPIGILIKSDRIKSLFDESHYRDLEGGILEGLGKLLDVDTKMYVYPIKTHGKCMGSRNFKPTGPLEHLYELYSSSGQIFDLEGCEKLPDHLKADYIRKLIKEKNSDWENHVPAPSVQIIKAKKLFGYVSR